MRAKLEFKHESVFLWLEKPGELVKITMISANLKGAQLPSQSSGWWCFLPPENTWTCIYSWGSQPQAGQTMQQLHHQPVIFYPVCGVWPKFPYLRISSWTDHQNHHSPPKRRMAMPQTGPRLDELKRAILKLPESEVGQSAWWAEKRPRRTSKGPLECSHLGEQEWHHGDIWWHSNSEVWDSKLNPGHQGSNVTKTRHQTSLMQIPSGPICGWNKWWICDWRWKGMNSNHVKHIQALSHVIPKVRLHRPETPNIPKQRVVGSQCTRYKQKRFCSW